MVALVSSVLYSVAHCPLHIEADIQIPMDAEIQKVSRQFAQVRTNVLTRQNFAAMIFEAQQLIAIEIRKADAWSQPSNVDVLFVPKPISDSAMTWLRS